MSEAPPEKSSPSAGEGFFTSLTTVKEKLEREKEQAGEGAIDAPMVQSALGLRSQHLARRLLIALTAGAGRDFATVEDFLAAAEETMSAPVPRKVAFLFAMYDEDGDGQLDLGEVERLMHVGLAEHDMKVGAGQVEDLAQALLTAGDRTGDGKVDRQEFARLVSEHPDMERRLAEYGVSLLMPGRRARERTLVGGTMWSEWLRNGAVVGAWLAAYGAANVLLFLLAFLRYRHAGANTFIQIARGCGACLNMNGALIVVPMLRRTLTWVRKSPLGGAVPVDAAVDFHRLVGETIMAFSVVHTAAHALNLHARGSWPWNKAIVTGVLLLLVLVAMWVFSRERVRRSRRFELFHVTHLGYFVFLPLLFAHGPVFWMWGVFPVAGYVAERLIRASRSAAPSCVVAANPLTSDVTCIELARPGGFAYAPGDYVFLRIPAIARHEWHPFTLTSAPEDSQSLTVHVRTAGNWTGAARQLLPGLVASGAAPVAQIDGPYGTCSRHVLDVPHAIAIAGGIGATPFASILQSLLLRQGAQNAPRVALRKLHFVWLNRDQYAFEWFRDLLAELEQRDRAGVLDVHTFLTTGRADLAGGMLDLVAHVRRSRAQGDIVTGLRAQTTMGAPDFDRLLEGFCKDPRLPRPEVFFCGPVALGRIVGRTCRRLGLRFRYERF